MNFHAPPGHDLDLDLSVACDRSGHSRLIRTRVSYPWSIGRGYRDDRNKKSLTVIPQTAGAGLLAGDCVRQSIAVGLGASLRLVSAGATLVHGATPQQTAETVWKFSAGPAASVLIAAEPHVLLEGADLHLKQEFVVADDARLIACDAFVLSDRSAQARWSSDTTAKRPDGRQLFTDRQVAGTEALAAIRRMPGALKAFGTILIFAPARFLPELQETLTGQIASASAPVWAACAPLRAEAGLGVRLAAKNGGWLRDVMIDLRDRAAFVLGID